MARMVQLSFQVPRPQYERLLDECLTHREARSEVVRNVLNGYLAEPWLVLGARTLGRSAKVERVALRIEPLSWALLKSWAGAHSSTITVFARSVLVEHLTGSNLDQRRRWLATLQQDGFYNPYRSL